MSLGSKSAEGERPQVSRMRVAAMFNPFHSISEEMLVAMICCITCSAYLFLITDQRDKFVDLKLG